MNDYIEFRRAMMERAQRAGAGSPSPGAKHARHCEAVVAAAAKVVSEKGIGWFEISTTEQQVEAITSELGVLARVVSWLAAIFFSGGPIWLSVIEWVLPIIADYLVTNEATALCGASGIDLGRQAEEFLKGM